MSVLTTIGIAVPPYKLGIMDIYQAVKDVHATTEQEKRALRFMYSTSGIATKYVCIPELHTDGPKVILSTSGAPASVEQRQAIYAVESLALAKKAIASCIADDQLSTVTHIITISCTGLSAPGLDVQLVQDLQLAKNVQRSSINFMGCYAAVHGLKTAHHIANSTPNAKVLVVCVELCSLHFQRDTHIDNTTSCIVFGDGAAAFIVESDQGQKGLCIKDFYSELALDGYDDMGWQVTHRGYLMTLSPEIPAIIERNAPQLFSNALVHYGISSEGLQYCVHPGGRKVLESTQKALGISKQQLDSSYEVLSNFGNMSSPTVMFVLQNLQQRLLASNSNGDNIVGVAFGPGITLETFYVQLRA
jgi:predicted naringenin-chalcone synthase